MSTHGDLRSATASSAWTGCGVLFACNTFVVFFLENWEHSVDIFSTTFLLNRVVCKCKKKKSFEPQRLLQLTHNSHFFERWAKQKERDKIFY
jgi:hypothetical protein